MSPPAAETSDNDSEKHPPSPIGRGPRLLYCCFRRLLPGGFEESVVCLPGFCQTLLQRICISVLPGRGRFVIFDTSGKRIAAC